MTDDQLLRYSRHVLLDGIGIEGQRKLLKARVLVIGAGGLGCAAALYLASSGVGSITLMDPDLVDTTNLQRQIAHTQSRVGWLKVHSLAQAMTAINPDIAVTAFAEKADAFLLAQCLPKMDIVLDCTDNFASRQLINQVCVQHGKVLVSGSASNFHGQVCVFDLRRSQSACYACLFPLADKPLESSCSTMGVFAPLVGIVGSMQAAETLKLLVQNESFHSIPEPGESISLARLIMVDSQRMVFEAMNFVQNSQCKICSNSLEIQSSAVE